MSGLFLRANPDFDPGHRVPSFWTHLFARLRHERLDRELARGTPSWSSRHHAARALQLTSRGRRRSLAQGLDRMLADSRRPTANCRRLSYIVPCRRSVLDCAPLLEDLASALESDLPLDARQVARLNLLARNGIGPFYSEGRRGELARALQQISAAIVADD